MVAMSWLEGMTARMMVRSMLRYSSIMAFTLEITRESWGQDNRGGRQNVRKESGCVHDSVCMIVHGRCLDLK